MTSVADTLLKGLDLNATFRPAALEDVMVTLIHTLAEHDLLDEAVSLVESKTGLNFTGNKLSLAGVAKHPYIPFLYKTPDAITMLLNLIPRLAVIESHEVIDLPEDMLSGHDTRTQRKNISRTIDAINRIDIGIKLYIPYRSLDSLGVITYDSHEGLIETLQHLELSTQIQDKILQ